MDSVKRVINAFNKANTFDTKLTHDIISLEGMSGIKTRILYNELCSAPNTVYFEVGSYKGSTLVSSLSNNSAKGYALDNWSEFGGPKTEFYENLKKFNVDATIFDEDFNTFDPSKIPEQITVYLYDGGHRFEDQRLGITKMWDKLAPGCIIIIDDWNADDVRNGTAMGLTEVNAQLIEMFQIRYTTDGSHTPFNYAHNEFWNGIAVFIKY
jgi:hypothetical protein